MVVKIITDSTSDISPEIAKELGIEVVPGYVKFGKELYRDGVDINQSGFYKKLAESPFHPETSEATPKDFAQAYLEYAHQADGIVSIHISSKISRMYNSAQKGKKMLKAKCEIEVIDSRFASVGLGLLVMRAARLANAGMSIENIIADTKMSIPGISMLGFFDTLKYVARGGRATKHVIELSTIFRIKPLLTFKDGEIVTWGTVRTKDRGIERLYTYVNNSLNITDLAIAYSTDYNSAVALKQRLASVFSEEKIFVNQIGPALGSHCGPDSIFVALRRAK